MMRIFENYKNKNKSIFTSWLVSYLTILLIPVIISAIVYYETGNVIKNEINRANTAILKQVVQVIDSSVLEIERLGMELMLNDRIKALMYVKKPLEYTDRYTIGDVVKRDMTLTGTANGFAKSYYIFFKNGDFVLKPGAYYEPEVAYQDFHQNSNLSYKQWYDMLQGNYYKICMPIEVNNEYSSKGSTLAYMQSFPVGNNAAANLVVLLNESYINEIVQNMEWIRKGNFYIIDKTNNVLMSNSGANDTLDLKYTALNKNSDIFYDNMEGESVAISYITSKTLDWKYVSVFPVHVYMEKAAYARKITLIGLLFCMLLGAMIAYVFTKRNYNPVNELVTVLKNKVTPESQILKNEYQFIRDAIYSTLTEKEEIGRKLELQNREMCLGFLARLLRGRVSSMSIHEMLSSYGIDFSSGRFAVMLFNIEDYRGFFQDEKMENEEKKLNLVEFAITNVVEELARQNHQCRMLEMNGMIVCLINLRNTDAEESKQELLRIASEAKNFTQESLYISLTISISDVHETVMSIPHAYQEALEALEYKMILGSGEIICFNEIKNPTHSYCYSMEMELQLINNIKIGNYEKSKEILNDIFNDSFGDASLSLEMTKCLMFDLSSTIIKTLNEFYGAFDKNLWQEIDPVENLLNLKTVKEMKKGMEEILKKVCRHIDSQKESHNVKLKEDIIEFIQQHYTDTNLGNTMIAEAFGINSAYLSRFFKEQAGDGILDFINRVRLDKAKQLLKEEKGKIGDIANQVGYYNNVALIRAFKKYEGITPGKYKEM